MLPDKFKEDRFERASTPSKNNKLLGIRPKHLFRMVSFDVWQGTLHMTYMYT